MANRYGEAALMVARQGISAQQGPLARWESAMEQLYPTSAGARKKGAPRAAFLGLCEDGWVKDIPPGSYKAPKDDKALAVRAAELLVEGKQSWSVGTLWRAVAGNPDKLHKGQIDIVMALWKNGFLVREP